MSLEKPLVVFCSYARKDEDLRRQLEDHLAVLKHRGDVRVWYESKILAGQERAPEIFDRLEEAHIILLLISSSFLASSFCWSCQMRRVMERHDTGKARVIPIIVRPVDWKNAPFAKLQVLPKSEKPVTLWDNQDAAFQVVVDEIRMIIESELCPSSKSGAAAHISRIVILIGHSITNPQPEAAEIAKVAAYELKDSGLAAELRIDQATMLHFEREARKGCDLLIYCGHGTESGDLSFADGRKSFVDLSHGDLRDFWNKLRACFLFSCSGDRFAIHLPCPWIAFTAPTLTQALSDFFRAFVPALKELDLAASVQEALKRCEMGAESSVTQFMHFSEEALPELPVASGKTLLSRTCPAITKNYRIDLSSKYPYQAPFVGRRSDLQSLMLLPLAFSGRPYQRRVVWVHGDAGMGKSALLREFATCVSDLIFHEADDPVYLLHLHCHKHPEPEDVKAALYARVQELYGMEDRPASLESLFAAIEGCTGGRGTHIWILDDLTYRSRPLHSMEEAALLAHDLLDLAQQHMLRWQLVVSSRQSGPPNFDQIRVDALNVTEAQELGSQIWSLRQGISATNSVDVQPGAEELFHLTRLTAHYTRSLIIAVAQGKSYREYANELRDAGSFVALEQRNATQKMIDFDLRQLGSMEDKHGFAYTRFLKICFSLIAHVNFFTRDELETWFGDSLLVVSTTQSDAYRIGLEYLALLNFLQVKKSHEGAEIFSLPPNQRRMMQDLSDPTVKLPEVPLRVAKDRLALALERSDQGVRQTINDLLLLESDYQDSLSDPIAASLVFQAMLIRAKLISDNPAKSISVFDRIVDLYDKWRTDYPDDDFEAARQVATALILKGHLLVKRKRSQEAIDAYGEVVSRFSDRREPGLAQRVASALFNKGIRLGRLNHLDEAIEVFGEVVLHFSHRHEPGFAERVAKALGSKGVCLAALGRYEEEIKAYDEIISRYGDRQEPGLGRQVALALFEKGFRLRKLGCAEEEIDVYDQIVSRYGTRQEPEFVDRISSALINKGVRLYALGRAEEAINVYDEVVGRYGNRQEPRIAELVARALFSKGAILGKLRRVDMAVEAFGEIISRYSSRQEFGLAERVAKALFERGVALSALTQKEAALKSFNHIVVLYGDRQESKLAEQVAKALVSKGVILGELGRSTESIEVFNDVVARFGNLQEGEFSVQVAKALRNKGVAFAGLGRNEEEIDSYDELVLLYGNSKEPEIIKQIQEALKNKQLTLISLGCNEQE